MKVQINIDNGDGTSRVHGTFEIPATPSIGSHLDLVSASGELSRARVVDVAFSIHDTEGFRAVVIDCEYV